MPREGWSLCRRSPCRLGGLPDGEPPRCAWRCHDRAYARQTCGAIREASADGSRPTSRAFEAPCDALLVARRRQRSGTLLSSASRIEARRVVVMRRAPCRPASAGFPSAEGLSDGFSGHGAPPCHRRRRACRRRSLVRASPPQPFGQDRRSRDVRDDLSGFLGAEITTKARAARPRGCARSVHLSGCRLLRAMFSPKTSRAVPRRSVLLASGLGFPPMTLDLRDLHLGRPHRRDRRSINGLISALPRRGS